MQRGKDVAEVAGAGADADQQQLPGKFTAQMLAQQDAAETSATR